MDSALLIPSLFGGTLCAAYAALAVMATHQGDFWVNRRWRASIWASLIVLVPLWIGFLFYAIPQPPGIHSSAGSRFVSIGLAILPTATVMIPALLICTLGNYYQLKLWLTSDDFLDKLWPPPPGHSRSAIQEL